MNNGRYVKFRDVISRDHIHAAGELSHAGRYPVSTGITVEGRRCRCLFPAFLRGFSMLALLLAGSIFLTGCSGNKSAGDSDPEWSFQAGSGQEEENPGNKKEENGEAAGMSGAEDGAVQSAADSAGNQGFSDSAGAKGTGSAGAEKSSGGGSTAEDSGSSDSAGAAAEFEFSGSTGTADAGTPGGTGTAGGSVVLSDGAGTAVSGVQEPGYVYICGAVRRPGVYEIGEGTRVFEVIEQAGGLTKQADGEWLNQAEIVVDGQKLQIYTKEETAAFKEAGLSAAGSMDQGLSAGAGGMPQGTDSQVTAGNGAAEQGAAVDDKVNINTADKDLLMTLPGIGESKAEAVLQYRQEHGNFGSIGDICQVSGIKEAVFSRIKDRITV